jgi:hypothetical protein
MQWKGDVPLKIIFNLVLTSMRLIDVLYPPPHAHVGARLSLLDCEHFRQMT